MKNAERELGSPGSRELINFGEVVGLTIDEFSFAKSPTTWGKIHHSKDGTHIVPCFGPRKIDSRLDRLLIGTQRALFGAITPTLRAVKVILDENLENQIFHFYYDGPIDEMVFDLATVAVTKASCFLDYKTYDSLVRVDRPKTIPEEGTFVYLRFEPNAKNFISSRREFHVPHPEANFLLYTQQALLGRVLPGLREVSVGIDSYNIQLIFIYDGEINLLAKNLAEQVVQEIASTYKKHKIRSQIERVDFPEAITSRGERGAFARYEKR